jgi:hypothetical protein
MVPFGPSMKLRGRFSRKMRSRWNESPLSDRNGSCGWRTGNPEVNSVVEKDGKFLVNRHGIPGVDEGYEAAGEKFKQDCENAALPLD